MLHIFSNISVLGRLTWDDSLVSGSCPSVGEFFYAFLPSRLATTQFGFE